MRKKRVLYNHHPQIIYSMANRKPKIRKGPEIRTLSHSFLFLSNIAEQHITWIYERPEVLKRSNSINA
jgi:hypothetical protein